MLHRNLLNVPQERLEEVREDFESVDHDQDGSIDFAEFTELMENLGAGASSTELRIGFSAIDDDHDGRISLAEFVAWRCQD
jgi:Ca2+-binding EF-hand superfamily protein